MRRFVLAPLAALVVGTAVIPARADSGIETVTVTAERRPEALLDVPVTATVLNGQTLHEDNVNNALDLQSLSPGLTVVGNLGSSDQAVFSIRGQNQPFGGADPGVQTYFAEVPFNMGGAGTDYDLDNVQVLEGPQGTLFGRNTTGGAVLFEPKRPDPTFGAYLDAEGGNLAFGQLQGAVNVPITDGLDLRVAGEIERRNGYTDDVSFGFHTDNVANEGARASLTWQPTESLKNYVVVSADWDDTHGTGDELTGISSPATPSGAAQIAGLTAVAVTTYQAALQGVDPLHYLTDGAACGTAAFNNFYSGTPATPNAFCSFVGNPGLVGALAIQKALGPRAVTSTIAPGWKREDWLAVDQTEWDVTDHFRLRNIFSYQNYKIDPRYDYDGSFLPLLEIENGRTWQTNSGTLTEELHAQGETADNALKWLAGYYYESDFAAGYSEIERQEFGGAVNPPLGTTEFQQLNSGGTSNAVFAQADWEVIPSLRLTAGGRYTWDRKDSLENDCILPEFGVCALPVTASPFIESFPQTGHFSAPTWNLAADYALDDSTHLYVTYRRGYKSGGFNSGGFGQGFKPEFLTDIEAGVKHAGTILGMPAAVSADAYYGWYDDIQKNDFTFAPGPGGTLIPIVATFNAARAHVDGFELQAEIKPIDLVDLSAFYGYTDASYDVFDTPFSGNHAGDPFAYTPRNKFGATGIFHFPVDPSWGNPSFQATVYYQSKEWFSDFADVEPDSSQGAYALVNLRFDWAAICGSNLDAGIFVNNVANTLYKVGGNPLEHLILTDSSMYGPPRLFGLELRYHVGNP